jgi:DNA-binding LytR/AlgR family response regulator
VCSWRDARFAARVMSLGQGRRYLARLRIADLEARLPRPPFLRVQRSHIVNLDQVERMIARDDRRLEVLMRDGARGADEPRPLSVDATPYAMSRFPA